MQHHARCLAASLTTTRAQLALSLDPPAFPSPPLQDGACFPSQLFAYGLPGNPQSGAAVQRSLAPLGGGGAAAQPPAWGFIGVDELGGFGLIWNLISFLSRHSHVACG